jgi:hypothetical protein
MMARRVHIGLVLLVLAALLVSPSICFAQSSADKAVTSGEKKDGKLPEKPRDEDVSKDDGKGSDDYDSFVDKDGDRVDDRWQGFSKKEDRDRDRDQDRDRDGTGDSDRDRVRDKERDQEQDRDRVKDNDSRAKDDARKPSPPKKVDNSGGSGKRGR